MFAACTLIRVFTRVTNSFGYIILLSLSHENIFSWIWSNFSSWQKNNKKADPRGLNQAVVKMSWFLYHKLGLDYIPNTWIMFGATRPRDSLCIGHQLEHFFKGVTGRTWQDFLQQITHLIITFRHSSRGCITTHAVLKFPELCQHINPPFSKDATHLNIITRRVPCSSSGITH